MRGRWEVGDAKTSSCTGLAGRSSPGICSHLSTLAIAVISRDGIVIDANLGFFNLLPNSMSAPDILDVRDLFVNPRFEHFATRRPRRAGGPVYRGILNMGSVLGWVCSLQGTVYALNDAVMIVAEHEIARLELLRTKVLQMNEELAEGQRKLAATLRELNRQRDFLEALPRSTQREAE